MRALRLVLLLLALVVAMPPAPLRAAAHPSPNTRIETLRHGFDLLMDHFVRPLSSDVLLRAAWRAAVAGSQDGRPIPSPLFTGSRERDWTLFREHWLQLHAGSADAAEAERQARAGLEAMAQAADEGHTFYLDPLRYSEYLAWLRGELRYAGIGARIAVAQPMVIEVFEASPAERAGLLVGDVITHVDGRPAEGHSLADAIALVRGEQGTAVELTVRRVGEPAPLVLRIVRAQIEIPVLRSRMLPGQVGYLHLRGFPDWFVVDQFEAVLAGLEAQGARALVLDLRDNRGGRLDVGARLLSLFVPNGPLYQQITRARANATFYATPLAEPFELPLVVLVDEGTASMAEIFASAVQEERAGLVIGQTTAGSVAGGRIFPLADGSALQVTVMEIRSGHGRRLNGVGVIPDLLVDNPLQELARGQDAQLDAALDLLLEPEPTHSNTDRAASSYASSA